MPAKIVTALILFIGLIFSPVAFAGMVDIASSHDAQVVEGSPTSNYGSTNNLYVASADGGTYLNERVWVKFDITGQIPAGAVINSAKLRLYCFKADDADDMIAAVHSSSADTWDESTITWNSQPAYSAGAVAQQTLNANQEYYWVEWDVTGFVQTETAGGDTVVSFVVRAAIESQDPWRTYAFDAKEYGAALAPRLRIDYNGDWPTTGAFKIFHMNDAHSRLLPHEFDVPEADDVVEMEMVGGAAYFASKMLELKTAHPESLILDAGDISEGNPLGDLRGNGGMIDFYNLLDTRLKDLGGRGIDAVVAGNHDVRSQQMLVNMKNANFPAISMNIIDLSTGNPYFPEHVIVTVNGTTVGILGYTNDESSYLGDDLVGVVEVKKCVWEDTDASTIDVKVKVEELRTTHGCDVVILLSHMGQSRVTSGDDAVIADSGGVVPPEVVISGHWHTWTERVWQPSNMNGKTIVAEAASYLQYIGEVEVTGAGKYVQAQKHAIRNSEITPDTDVEALITALTTEYDSGSPPHALNEVVGYSAVDLTMDKDKWWTVSEYPWAATNAAGSWITDAMVWKANQRGFPVDLALQSGGGIRRDIAAGEITYIEIYEAYPWSDDNMVRVQMTGQEIWDWIQADHVGTSISANWHVTAHDGQVTAITFSGSPINPGGAYNVAISEYMFAHPEITITDTTPEDVGYSIREGVVDFTGQSNTPANPMYAGGIAPRYTLNTEFAGGFRAVVTMIADSESQPYFEDAFIRLIEATPRTLARRTGYGLTDLVKSDGAVDLQHRFSEIMLYRSHLGFTDGLLQPGDIIEVWGEGGFFDGTPELIDQEGISTDGYEFIIHGRDETLARPEYHATIATFWDEAHENHYVKFYAEKTGDTTVQDSAGQSLTTYKEGGYYTKPLPGNVGDILELTGVNTYEGDDGRRFRCHTAVVASTVPVIGYPATSAVDAIDPYAQSGTAITLTATASDIGSGSPGSGTLIAYTSFEEPGTGGRYTDTLGSATSHTLINNAGEAPVNYTAAGAELGFSSYYTSTGGEGLTDGDYVGVTTYTPVSDGSFTDGSQGFEMQDTDGIMTTTLDAVDITGYTTVTVSADLFIKADSWEATDVIRIWVTVDGGAEIDLINTAGSDIDDLGIEGSWRLVSADLSDNTTATLHISLEANAANETIWVDNIRFEGDASGGSGTTVAPEQVAFYYRYAPDGLAWGAWTSIGTDMESSDGWSRAFSYPDSQGTYEFYTISTDADGNVEDAPVRADARAFFNNLPPAPTDPSIPDGAVDVSLSPTLSVTVSDPEATSVDVHFYDSSDNLIGSDIGVASGQTASTAWIGLSENTQYGWYVVIDDGLGTTQSPTWAFTTRDGAPVSVPAVNVTGLCTITAVLICFGAVALRRRNAL
jgi:2',3'-cyclic-nucleotide 2'-phosphodiesterase (5'-nucleotidase family)